MFDLLERANSSWQRTTDSGEKAAWFLAGFRATRISAATASCSGPRSSGQHSTSTTKGLSAVQPPEEGASCPRIAVLYDFSHSFDAELSLASPAVAQGLRSRYQGSQVLRPAAFPRYAPSKESASARCLCPCWTCASLDHLGRLRLPDRWRRCRRRESR